MSENDKENGYCTQHNTICVAQARTEEKVEGLKDCMGEVKKSIEDLDTKVDGIKADIGKLYGKMNKRPSWATAGAITIMVTVIASLIIFIATGGS
jgi:hypothetical protein